MSLAARDITKRFGGLTALSQVSLKLMPGEVHGLRVGVTNHYMSDGYYRVKEGASPSPY